MRRDGSRIRHVDFAAFACSKLLRSLEEDGDGTQEPSGIQMEFPITSWSRFPRGGVVYRARQKKS